MQNNNIKIYACAHMTLKNYVWYNMHHNIWAFVYSEKCMYLIITKW